MHKTPYALSLCALVAFGAQNALADELILTPADMSFDDATFFVESAIVGQGLQIDYVSHVGEMLARTREDVGGTQVLFENARIYLFCSASLSRQAMEVDWRNVASCPYAVQILQRPGGEVHIGYTHRDANGMEPVNELLAEIVAETVE